MGSCKERTNALLTKEIMLLGPRSGLYVEPLTWMSIE